VADKEPIGLLIGAARRQLKRAATVRARAHSLSSQQFWVLVNIDEADGASLGEVAARLRMDAPTASRTVTQLLGRGLVKAEGDRGDRRRLRLKLTAAGRARMPALRELAAELRALPVQGLGREEEESLRALLRKMLASLDGRPGER
jgi:DNA-binding MarR family transcriptional regulator